MRGLFGEFCPDEADLEARSLLVGSQWIGSHFFAADHDERSRGDVLEIALSRL